MNKTLYFVLALLITAGITYLIRLLPMICVRGRVKNRFLKSFLYYVPHTVLSTLTFPAILFCTESYISGILAVVVSIFLAYKGKGLITCMLGGVMTVFLTGLILTFI